MAAETPANGALAAEKAADGGVSVASLIDALGASPGDVGHCQRLAEEIEEKKGARTFTTAVSSMLDALGANSAEGFASAKRLEEIKERREETLFTNAAGSLLDAIDDVKHSKPSLLEDHHGAASQAASLGKGLSVIDQFALRLHHKQAGQGAFEGSALASAALVRKPKPSGNSALSKKARRRAEQSKARGIAYAERAQLKNPLARGTGKGAAGKSNSGPTRRNRSRNRDTRASLI